MATRGWENTTPQDIARLERSAAPAPRRSKYRNVKVVVQGETFDSRREADYWLVLQARERAGEIRQLRRQVSLPLYTADAALWGRTQVAVYIADFVYLEDGRSRVVDAKGVRTPMYRLKKKWLFLQDGIEIEEV